MIKKSLTKVFLVGTGNVINAGLGFAFLAATAKNLDLDTFGKYALLVSLLIVISKIIDFGTNSTFVSKYISEKDFNLIQSFYYLKFILFLVTIPISIVTLLYFNLAESSIILIFILGLIAYGTNYILFAFFQQSQKFELIVAINTVPALIKGVFAVLVFLKIVSLNLTGAFSIFALSIFAGLIFYIWVPENFKKISFSKDHLKSLFTKSTPAGISQLIQEGWPAFNNSISNFFGGFSDVGVFSLAHKISNIFVLASLSIFTVLLPKNALRKKQKSGYDFAETAIMAGGILFLAVLATFIGNYFVGIIFGEKFVETAAILNILIFASAFTAIHTFLENYFFVQDKTTNILYINFGKLAAFIIFSILLVPYFSLTGLAYANLISALLGITVSLILIKKINKTNEPALLN